jgi:hypothetical protein
MGVRCKETKDLMNVMPIYAGKEHWLCMTTLTDRDRNKHVITSKTTGYVKLKMAVRDIPEPKQKVETCDV